MVCLCAYSKPQEARSYGLNPVALPPPNSLLHPTSPNGAGVEWGCKLAISIKSVLALLERKARMQVI